MKFFSLSQSNFIKINHGNINFKNYLRHVWNVETYYTNTFVKGKYAPASTKTPKPGLLTQNVELQDVDHGRMEDINMQTSISLRDLITQMPATGVLQRKTTAARTETQTTVTTQDIGTQISVQGVFNSREFAKAIGANTERKTKVSTQDVATQMSIQASILHDVCDVCPKEQVPSYQVNPKNPTQSYDLTIQRDEILRRHANLPLLNPQEFQFLNLLGKGAKGSVYLAMRNNTVPTAVKVYHSEYSSKLQKDISNEASILSILQDTGFVPRIHGCLIDPSDARKMMLVQEFFGNGRTLWSILNGRDPNIVLNTAIKINIAYQLVYALKAIHDKDVLINDIKSNNVLVDTSTPDCRIRYIDFDLATFQGSYRYSIQAGNAFAAIFGGQEFSWLAPEVRMGGPTTPQSDIYSVGFLISELQCPQLQEVAFVCTQEKPFHRPNLDVILNMVEFIMSVN